MHLSTKLRRPLFTRIMAYAQTRLCLNILPSNELPRIGDLVPKSHNENSIQCGKASHVDQKYHRISSWKEGLFWGWPIRKECLPDSHLCPVSLFSRPQRVSSRHHRCRGWIASGWRRCRSNTLCKRPRRISNLARVATASVEPSRASENVSGTSGIGTKIRQPSFVCGTFVHLF